MTSQCIGAPVPGWGVSKNRLFWRFLRSHFWLSSTFCEVFFKVINVILHIVIYPTGVFQMSPELRFISGVMYKMSFNVANTALRLIMCIYIISPIEIVFVCEIGVEYRWWLVFLVFPSGSGHCGHLYTDLSSICLHRYSPKNSSILRIGIWLCYVNFTSFQWV